MPLTYRIYSDVRLLLIRGEGVITQDERIHAMHDWMHDPAYGDCDDALCDFSAAESTPTMAELRELVGLMTQGNRGTGPGKLAVVAPKPITFVVAREFKARAQLAEVPLEIQVFADKNLAWAWLRPEAFPMQE